MTLSVKLISASCNLNSDLIMDNSINAEDTLNISCKILVDADACPQTVRKIIENACEHYGIELQFFTDTNHEIDSDLGEVIIVDQGHDSVDLAIINRLAANNIVVTQDYGLASLVLAKGAQAIHPSGKVYSAANIDFLLMDRHLSARSRRAGERLPRHRRRDVRDDSSFKDNLRKLLVETT